MYQARKVSGRVYVLGISIFPLSTILLLDFGILKFFRQCGISFISFYLRIDRNFCSVHEEITSIRLYTPCNPRSELRKGVYNLIEVISNEPNK